MFKSPEEYFLKSMAWFWHKVKTCELGFVLDAAFKVARRSRQVLFSSGASCDFTFGLPEMEVL
jgi:hypothetical protein